LNQESEALASQIDDEPPLSTKKWTLRRVVKEKLADEIDELTEQLSGATKGTSRYISFYPSAWTQVEQGLSEKVKKEFENLAEKWNKAGPPKELQQKYVTLFIFIL
jgi:hypothetical protein